MSNNKFTEIFQAIVSILHSLHHLHGVATYSYIAIGCDCVSACASFSISMSITHAIPCMLQTLLQMFFYSFRACQYFIQGLSYSMLHIYLVTHHYYGHMAAIHIRINFNKLLWNYEFIITKIYFH